MAEELSARLQLKLQVEASRARVLLALPVQHHLHHMVVRGGGRPLQMPPPAPQAQNALTPSLELVLDLRLPASRLLICRSRCPTARQRLGGQQALGPAPAAPPVPLAIVPKQPQCCLLAPPESGWPACRCHCHLLCRLHPCCHRRFLPLHLPLVVVYQLADGLDLLKTIVAGLSAGSSATLPHPLAAHRVRFGRLCTRKQSSIHDLNRLAGRATQPLQHFQAIQIVQVKALPA
jgi:hypothetical protein